MRDGDRRADLVEIAEVHVVQPVRRDADPIAPGALRRTTIEETSRARRPDVGELDHAAFGGSGGSAKVRIRPAGNAEDVEEDRAAGRMLRVPREAHAAADPPGLQAEVDL